jgi:transposase InsO family protein
VPWAGPVADQRREFVRAVSRGVPIAEACRRFGISRPTGYKWLARFEDQGESGLVDQSRRPHRSPDVTPSHIEQLVVETRRRFPAWGGRKLRAFLINQGHDRVPAASTITAILVRNGLMVSTPRPPAPTIRFNAESPNDLWQMDFKGHFPLADGTRCHPHGILDDHSRFNLALTACHDETTRTVHDALDRTFRTYGRPVAILADNGPPWGSSNPNYRWTPLKVWLADLDIGVIHSRPRHPQTVGKEERFHLTLITELLALNPAYPDLATIQDAFTEWRHVYNTLRPHESLDNQVPANHYQPSPRHWPVPIPAPTYPDHWDIRIVSPAAQISYQGSIHLIGKAFIGRTIAIDPHTYIAYYRNIPIRHVNHVPEHP